LPENEIPRKPNLLPGWAPLTDLKRGRRRCRVRGPSIRPGALRGLEFLRLLSGMLVAPRSDNRLDAGSLLDLADGECAKL